MYFFKHIFMFNAHYKYLLRVNIKCLPWNDTTLTESKPMHILTGLPGTGGVLGAGGVPGAGTGLAGGHGGM